MVLLITAACQAPAPSGQGSPTAGSTPSATVATAIPEVICEPFAAAKPAVGKTACVEGTVVKSYNIGNDFHMEFDASATSVYGIAHNYFYPGIDGACVRLTGEVKADKTGRTYLQVDLPGQVEPCPR